MNPAEDLKKLANELEKTADNPIYTAEKDGVKIEIFRSGSRGGAGSWSRITNAPPETVEMTQKVLAYFEGDVELEDPDLEVKFGEALGKIAEAVLYPNEDSLFAQADPSTQEAYTNMAKDEEVTPARAFVNSLHDGLASEDIPTEIEGNIITLKPQITY